MHNPGIGGGVGVGDSKMLTLLHSSFFMSDGQGPDRCATHFVSYDDHLKFCPHYWENDRSRKILLEHISFRLGQEHGTAFNEQHFWRSVVDEALTGELPCARTSLCFITPVIKSVEIQFGVLSFKITNWFKHILLFQFYSQHTNTYIQYKFRNGNESLNAHRVPLPDMKKLCARWRK